MITKDYFRSFTAKSFRVIHERKLNVSVGLSFLINNEKELKELKETFETLKSKYQETFYFFFTNSKDNIDEE